MTQLTPPVSRSGTATPAPRTAEAIAAATPPDRDRYVDLLRVVSMAAVVVGHWVLVVVVVDGAPVGRSLAAQLATWGLVTVPLFFAVGGYGHARALGSPRRRPLAGFVVTRVERMLGPVVVLLAPWAVLGAAVDLVGGGLAAGPVALALDRVPTPLWFVAVYLLVTLAAPLAWRLHRRLGGVRAVAVLVAGVAALDVLRFAGDQSWAGTANLVLVWLAVHQLGFLWADGRLNRTGTAGALAAAGLAAAVVLTLVTGWYPVDMQGLPGSDADNFSPPTLALLAHGAGMLGLALLLRRPVGRWLARPRPWAAVVTGNSLIMTVFCWHLPAAFAGYGVLLLFDVTPPATLDPAWWLALPAWVATCLVVLAAVAVPLRRAERWAVLDAQRPRRGRWAGRVVPVATAVLAVGVLATSQVGLDGLLSGGTETVLGVAVPAWLPPVALALALAALRRTGSPEPRRRGAGSVVRSGRRWGGSPA